jgi:hypothetical protein
MPQESNPNKINPIEVTLDKPYIEEPQSESARILNFLEEVRDGKVGGVWGDVDYKAPSEGYQIIQNKIASLKQADERKRRLHYILLNNTSNQQKMLDEADQSTGNQKASIENTLLQVAAEGQANAPMDDEEKKQLEKAFRGGFREEIELKRTEAQLAKVTEQLQLITALREELETTPDNQLNSDAYKTAYQELQKLADKVRYPEYLKDVVFQAKLAFRDQTQRVLREQSKTHEPSMIRAKVDRGSAPVTQNSEPVKPRGFAGVVSSIRNWFKRI